ncbi:MAG: Holliday junction branch migration protein RuvA [Verrucomicrobiae bacterium]|nr:Holliday junction branch migration protein RuvA [Verrucomicrobiae bacterium]
MISYLNGKLVRSLPTMVEMELNGIGYNVLIPLSTYDKLPTPPAALKLLTHFHVREDAQILYGFATEEERSLFQLLINHVSGVGPKIALGVLSGISVTQFRAAVVNNDLQTLSRIKGLGKKTAEKMIVELRDKVGVSAAWEQASQDLALSPQAQRVNDAVLALIALGYKQIEAHRAIKQVQEKQPEALVEDLVREALKSL